MTCHRHCKYSLIFLIPSGGGFSTFWFFRRYEVAPQPKPRTRQNVEKCDVIQLTSMAIQADTMLGCCIFRLKRISNPNWPNFRSFTKGFFSSVFLGSRLHNFGVGSGVFICQLFRNGASIFHSKIFPNKNQTKWHVCSFSGLASVLVP